MVKKGLWSTLLTEINEMMAETLSIIRKMQHIVKLTKTL